MLRYHIIIFGYILLVVIFSASSVSPDILCIICCLQSKSAVMQQTCMNFRFLAAKQP